MERLARFVVRFPWLVVVFWVLGIGVVVAAPPSGSAPNTPPPQPTGAQRAYTLLDRAFPASATSGNHPPVSVLLLSGQGPLALADMRRLAGLGGFLRRWKLDNGAPMVSWPPVRRLSRDGRAYLVSVTFPWTDHCYSCQTTMEVQLAAIRPLLRAGTSVELTGQGLIYQTQDKALSGLVGSGLSPTLLACIVLLMILSLVYRAPLAVLVPLLCIGAAVYTSIVLVKTLAVHTSWVPHGDITDEFVSIVLFGAGTSYCIFLLSRYRESLRDGVAPGAAIVHSLARVGAAISTSAATVIAATAVMGFTLSPMFRAIGPSVAVAVGLMLLAGLTLVPALMRLCGRALLWPSAPRVRTSSATAPEDSLLIPSSAPTSGLDPTRGLEPVPEAQRQYPEGTRDMRVKREDACAVPRGFWGWVGGVIVASPLGVAVACLLVLAPLAARTLPSSNVAVRTAEAIQAHFGSTSEPGTLVVHVPGLDLGSPAGTRVIGTLQAAAHGVAGVLQVGRVTLSPDGHVAAVGLTLGVETSSPAAHRLIGQLQDALAGAVGTLHHPGLEALLASDSAWTHDEAVQVAGDFRFIVLWVSLIIFAILALLVRSILAPFYLLLSVAISAGASVGLTTLIFHLLMGQQIYYTTPVFAFVFLVALGEDFNILLMSRIREEVWRFGLRAGVARAVAGTGGTLSNCGLIMAGTFGVLMSFQVTFLQQVGFAVAAGVLLDTFVVRPLLVPAVVCLLGRWNWVTLGGPVTLPVPCR